MAREKYLKSRMRAHYGITYSDALSRYTGGYWAKLMTPEETWLIRPNGTIAEVRRHQRRTKIEPQKGT